MSFAVSNTSPEGPLRQTSGRAIAAVALGIVALLAFLLLTLPTDLLLFDLSGIPILGVIAMTLYPLALGPEILFSPIGLLLAIVAIMVAGGRSSHSPSASLARVGALLGWAVVALDALSLVLIILSFQGALKPLI